MAEIMSLSAAVSEFIQDGESGSRTAGPLLRTFLNGAGRT